MQPQGWDHPLSGFWLTVLRVALGTCTAATLSLNWSALAMAEPRTGTSEPDQKIVDPPMPGVSKERFLWHLGPPPYPETSLEDLFVNGSSIDDDVTIPWVRCGTCKDGVYYFGNPRVLPYECPAELRPLLQERGPLPRAEWDRLVAKFNAHNESVGRRSVITPACKFPHFKWRVPSRPDGDVFWQYMAPPINPSVVSRRLRDLLEPHKLQGVSFYSVRVDHAGTLNPKARPLPTDYIEEMFDVCPRMDAAARQQLDFYSLVVPSAPNDMIFCEDFCPECKQVRSSESEREYALRSRYWEKHQTDKTIPRHATLDTDVFEAWPFQGVIASERVAKLFESLKLDNVAISKIKVLDETPKESLQRLLEEERLGEAKTDLPP